MSALLGAVALALLVSACGGNGLSLARQACVHVDAALRLYTASEHAGSPRQASADLTRSVEDLEAAEPLAAQATSADPQWNPLMTTLQEVGRNAEAHLIPALRAQCVQADTTGEQAPAIPSAVPGQTPTATSTPTPPTSSRPTGGAGSGGTTTTVPTSTPRTSATTAAPVPTQPRSPPAAADAAS